MGKVCEDRCKNEQAKEPERAGEPEKPEIPERAAPSPGYAGYSGIHAEERERGKDRQL